jgi:uncharacterized protein YggE
MRTRQLWIAVATSAMFLVLAGVLALGQAELAPTAARAQTGAESPRTITVVGEGTVTIKPDVARANIGVEVMGSSVQEASSAATATMEAVLAAFQQQGIEAKDIQTSGFSIWVDRPYGPEGLPSETPVYRVSNNVAVAVRDLDSVGAVLDAAITAGANSIYGISFDLDDPSLVESEAREKAVANAEAKAQELAEFNNLQLGEVLSVSEVVGAAVPYFSGSFRESAAAPGLGGGGAGPISPGELTFTMQLQIVYAAQ